MSNKKANPWIDHIKAYAKKNNITYGCALSLPDCKNTYKKKSEKKADKKKDKKKADKEVDKEVDKEDVDENEEIEEIEMNSDEEQPNNNKVASFMKQQKIRMEKERRATRTKEAVTKIKRFINSIKNKTPDEKQEAINKKMITLKKKEGENFYLIKELQKYI